MKPKGLGRGLSALLPDAEVEAPAMGALEIPVRDIKPNPQQPRRDFGENELDELTASIRQKGVIQPLVVRRSGDGFDLIAGERRLRAARQAGLDTVPVRVIEVTGDAELLEISLIENLQRNDLNPVELAEGYRALQRTFGLTQEQIARRVGKERATVANTLRLLELPEPILTSLRSGKITTGHAKAILSVTGTAQRSALWKRIVAENLSVRQTEEIARAVAAPKKVRRRASRPTESPLVRDYTDRLRRTLGTQVRIQKRGKKGTIRIDFYSDDDLTRLVEFLTGKRDEW